MNIKEEFIKRHIASNEKRQSGWFRESLEMMMKGIQEIDYQWCMGLVDHDVKSNYGGGILEIIFELYCEDKTIDEVIASKVNEGSECEYRTEAAQEGYEAAISGSDHMIYEEDVELLDQIKKELKI